MIHKAFCMASNTRSQSDVALCEGSKLRDGVSVQTINLETDVYSAHRAYQVLFEAKGKYHLNM